MVIDTYFPMKEKGECVGGIALQEVHPNMKIPIWEVYKVYPISERTVLFQKNDSEFCVTNGTYEHEMGTITLRVINDFLNVRVKVKSHVK